MEKILYEVRPRGQFMLQGYMVEARNPEEAIEELMGRNPKTCIVIDQESLSWWLIPKIGHWASPVVQIGKKFIHPNHPHPENRMAIAEACEEASQRREETPSLEFTNFDDQLKEYEKEQYTNASISRTAECLKECALAEAEITTGTIKKVQQTWSRAESLLKEANMYAKMSHIDGAADPNRAEKAVKKAKKQLRKTIEKIWDYEMKTVYSNPDRGLDAA